MGQVAKTKTLHTLRIKGIVSRVIIVMGMALVCLIGSLLQPLYAQTSENSPQPAVEKGESAPIPKTLKVATRVLAPFVIRENGELTGFSVELWHALTREAGLRFEFVEEVTLANLLQSVREERADVGIAAISITSEREKDFDFSQPMFDSGLQILTISDGKSNESSLQGLFSLFQSSNFISILGLLFVLMVVPVPVIWFLERPSGVASLVHSSSKVGQVFKSLWWSSSMVAGQATEMPSSFLGRIFAVIWMFVGLVFVSYFTATVTTSLTIRQLQSGISSPKDLVGKSVGTVSASTSSVYLKQNKLSVVEFPKIEEAFEALETGKIAAVVYDSPVLLYYASKEGKGKVQVVGSIFKPENYGILFPTDSALRKTINAALLRLKESGEYRTIYRRWFASEVPENG
jgi:polar amino acid transport system substrate-binding protein